MICHALMSANALYLDISLADFLVAVVVVISILSDIARIGFQNQIDFVAKLLILLMTCLLHLPKEFHQLFFLNRFSDEKGDLVLSSHNK